MLAIETFSFNFSKFLILMIMRKLKAKKFLWWTDQKTFCPLTNCLPDILPTWHYSYRIFCQLLTNKFSENNRYKILLEFIWTNFDSFVLEISEKNPYYSIMSRLSWLMIFPSKIFLQLYDLVDTIFLVDGRWGLVHWPSFHSKEISAGACTSDNTFLKVIIDNRITVVLLKSKNYSKGIWKPGYTKGNF